MNGNEVDVLFARCPQQQVCKPGAEEGGHAAFPAGK